MKVSLLKKDLSLLDLNKIISNSGYISIDTETTGLNILTDNIELVQISTDNQCYLIRINDKQTYPNLSLLLGKSNVKKIFHNAIFDIRFLKKIFGKINFEAIICTKISEKIITESVENSSLKILVQKYKGISLDKSEQLSNWGSPDYSKSQIEYAIRDVIHLKEIWSLQKKILLDTNKFEIAKKSFDFISNQIALEELQLPNVFKY